MHTLSDALVRLPMASTEATSPSNPEIRPSAAIIDERFDITAKSVLYQRDNASGTPTCIVILNISFTFRVNAHLKNAKLPVSVTAPARDPALDYYFHANLPDKEYMVVINDSVIQNDVVEQGLAPVGSSPSGRVDESESVKTGNLKQISLGGQSLANQQRISWNFDNSSCTIYPETVRVMVIVRSTENLNKLFFPFELHLGSDFEIYGFGRGEKKSWWKFMARPSTSSRHIGIRGNFNEDLARKAFADIERFSTRKEPEVIGLRVAMRSYANRVMVGREKIKAI